MNTREMIEIFYEIDVNRSGTVSKKELSSYLGKRDISPEIIEQLIGLFEESNEEISFEEFCTQLNEEVSEVECPESHDKDIEIITSKMSNFLKEWAVANILRRAEEKCKDNKEKSEYIKKALDQQMEPMWHCLIVKGQYWAFYSYEPESSLVLKYKNNVYILFKTPGN